jgi:hypothetical protein
MIAQACETADMPRAFSERRYASEARGMLFRLALHSRSDALVARISTPENRRTWSRNVGKSARLSFCVRICSLTTNRPHNRGVGPYGRASFAASSSEIARANQMVAPLSRSEDTYGMTRKFPFPDAYQLHLQK